MVWQVASSAHLMMTVTAEISRNEPLDVRGTSLRVRLDTDLNHVSLSPKRAVTHGEAGRLRTPPLTLVVSHIVGGDNLSVATSLT